MMLDTLKRQITLFLIFPTLNSFFSYTHDKYTFIMLTIFFTITAEILMPSFAIFIVNKETDTWIYNLCNVPMSKSRQFDNFVIVNKKDASFKCVCPVTDNETCHNIVEVVCSFTQLLAGGSTATLIMLWKNSWSITGQMEEKLINLISVHYVHLSQQRQQHEYLPGLSTVGFP